MSAPPAWDEPALEVEHARALEHCVAGGGLAVVPTDTVYGVVCDPFAAAAVARLHALKGRPDGKPSGIMLSRRDRLAGALHPLPPRTEAAVHALLPGGVTLVLPDADGRWALAAGAGGAGTFGLRVPRLAGRLRALREVRAPLLQSSANLAGEPAARSLAEVPATLLDGVDLVLDGGELPGIASTVVDLTAYEREGRHAVLREGVVRPEQVEAALRRVER